MRTNIAAGRAWRPSRFTIVISFSTFWPDTARFALRYSKPITSLFLFHQIEQLRVEPDGAVFAQALQFLIHRRNFDQARHVATGSHGNSHVRHLKPENFVKFPIKPDSIDRLHLLPILQRRDQIEALLDSNTANTENGRHVNDANPANFHVITGQFRRGRHELASLKRSDPRHVVGYQAITTLDQPKDAFAFADAARAANQNA